MEQEVTVIEEKELGPCGTCGLDGVRLESGLHMHKVPDALTGAVTRQARGRGGCKAYKARLAAGVVEVGAGNDWRRLLPRNAPTKAKEATVGPAAVEVKVCKFATYGCLQKGGPMTLRLHESACAFDPVPREVAPRVASATTHALLEETWKDIPAAAPMDALQQVDVVRVPLIKAVKPSEFTCQYCELPFKKTSKRNNHERRACWKRPNATRNGRPIDPNLKGTPCPHCRVALPTIASMSGHVEDCPRNPKPPQVSSYKVRAEMRAERLLAGNAVVPATAAKATPVPAVARAPVPQVKVEQVEVVARRMPVTVADLDPCRYTEYGCQERGGMVALRVHQLKCPHRPAAVKPAPASMPCVECGTTAHGLTTSPDGEALCPRCRRRAEGKPAGKQPDLAAELEKALPTPGGHYRRSEDDAPEWRFTPPQPKRVNAPGAPETPTLAPTAAATTHVRKEPDTKTQEKLAMQTTTLDTTKQLPGTKQPCPDCGNAYKTNSDGKMRNHACNRPNGATPKTLVVVKAKGPVPSMASTQARNEGQVLDFIEKNPGCTVADMRRGIDLAGSTIGDVVDRLTRAGEVRLEPHHDARMKMHFIGKAVPGNGKAVAVVAAAKPAKAVVAPKKVAKAPEVVKAAPKTTAEKAPIGALTAPMAAKGGRYVLQGRIHDVIPVSVEGDLKEVRDLWSKLEAENATFEFTSITKKA